MQGLADGYFVLPYTIQNYLSDQIQVPRFSTDLPEFNEAEKNIQARINKLMSIKVKSLLILSTNVWDTSCGNTSVWLVTQRA